VPSRAIIESLQASGIEMVQVTYHFEKVEVRGLYVAHQPLDVPPTWHYMRRGEWYELVGMPKEKDEEVQARMLCGKRDEPCGEPNEFCVRCG
jgi:hypothetical protein